MPKTITVENGDCFINLSNQEGFFWETIWNHPQNAALRQRRKHLNVLKKADEVFIPDRTIKEVSRETEKTHYFVRKGLPARFTLTLLQLGQPRANERYILNVDGNTREGITDANGRLSEPIPPGARQGLLLVGENQEEIDINFGYVDPIDEITGVQTRLQNLGFYDGELADELNPEIVAAIAEFQRSVELPGEGELTDQTRQALVRVHGS